MRKLNAAASIFSGLFSFLSKFNSKNMKGRFSIVFTVVLSTTFGFANDDQRVSATLTHATVFLNRAQLTATTKTTLNVGTTNVIIDNLPTNLDPQSIQVQGKGDAVIAGVQFGRDFLKNAPKSVVIQKLEDSLRVAKNELKVQEMSQSVWENERLLVLNNKAIGGAQTGVKVVDLKDMANFYRERLTDIGTKLIGIEQKITNQKDKIQRFYQQLKEQSAGQNRPNGQIKIALLANTKGIIELKISYLVHEAGWSPVYDLRAKDTKSPIKLAYKANVYQSTGIDWDKVKLTLSTANPTLGGTKPEMTTSYVDFYEPQAAAPVPVRAMMKSARDGKERESATMEATSEAVEITTTAATTQITEAPTAVNFDIALPYSLASGGNAQTVDVQAVDLPVLFGYYAAPRLDTDAFLVAKMSGWEKYNLLNGTANLYFEGTYVGQSELNVANLKDTLVLSLGRDKKVLIKREQLNEYSSRKAFGSNIKETFSYRITVRNNKSEAIDLHLEDQIPVSRSSQIEIELLQTTGAQMNAENGKLSWNLRLNPNESRIFDLQYSIKYPKGKTITTTY